MVLPVVGLSRTPSLTLLVALVLLLLSSGLVEGSRLGVAILVVLLGLVLLTAVHVVTYERRHRIVPACLALAWLAFTLWHLAAPAYPVKIASVIAFIAFGGIVVAVVLHRIVTAAKVDSEVICGSIALYLLLSVNWAVSYHLLETLSPGSFSNVGPLEAIMSNQFLYYSLTTITTLGYGDITPATPFAQIWSTMEAVTGVFYMAVLVARLVSLYR